MSDLILKRSAAISIELTKRSEEKRTLLQTNEVMLGMTEVEYRATCASVLAYNDDGQVLVSSRPIKSLTREELSNEIADGLQFIVRDLGIKNWNGNDAAYEAGRFLKLLKDYYSSMTYKEVENAFELLMAGHLDEYLPKNGQGQADKGHYQSFSAEFITKVLNAYKQYSRKTWSKVYKLLPEIAAEVSEKDKRESMDHLIKTIVKCFKNHKEGLPYSFIMPQVIVTELIKVGAMKEKPVITEEHKNKAFLYTVQNSNSKNEKDRIKKLRIDGFVEPRVASNAKNMASAEAIRNLFDDLIKQKKEVESFFNI